MPAMTVSDPAGRTLDLAALRVAIGRDQAELVARLTEKAVPSEGIPEEELEDGY